jgi:hypothetical protein
MRMCAHHPAHQCTPLCGADTSTHQQLAQPSSREQRRSACRLRGVMNAKMMHVHVRLCCPRKPDQAAAAPPLKQCQ